ncbi:MAG TPA: endonuclease Q family protein [Nitrospirota bacterium]|nr:endonuclease Q family protein [Nitrospirota bacterium]
MHTHSKYSRATSKDMCPEGLWKWAQMKGINVIGTGDFTHPEWSKELTKKLGPAGEGLFALGKKHRAEDVPASCRADVFFILSTEISCIYSKNGRTRKVHCIVLMPDLAGVERLSSSLAKIGNLRSDGRPILGLDAKLLLQMTLDASPGAMLIPAHIWTPHFSVFGSASGFDSLEECFEELTPHIHALETGLSSDPAMNWRLSSLDRITLVSNSDAHSAAKIGREANIFDTDITYGAMMDSLRTRKGFLGTIEFFPEEGKYHYDGHRACGVSLTPKETVKHGFLCPVCGGKLTVGVMHRVERLADRKEGSRPEGAPGYTSIIPLPELIAEAMKVGANSKKVGALYRAMLEQLGNEFRILLDVPLTEIELASSPLLAEAIGRMREGKVNIEPGYDGEYGKIKIFGKAEKKVRKGQMKLI